MNYLRPLLFMTCLLLAFTLGTLWQTHKASAQNAGVSQPHMLSAPIPSRLTAQLQEAREPEAPRPSRGTAGPTGTGQPPASSSSTGFTCTATSPLTGSTTAIASIVCVGNVDGSGNSKVLYLDMYNDSSGRAQWNSCLEASVAYGCLN